MGYRKTIDRELLVQCANDILDSAGSTREGREAVQTLVEWVLIEGNSYKGFSNTLDRTDPDYNNRVIYG